MKTIIRIWAIGLLLTLAVSSLRGQQSFEESKVRIGFLTGYGDQTLLDVKYDYRVTFFRLQAYYGLIRKPSWGIDLLLQPQYNLTTFRYNIADQDEVSGYEYGLNIGVLIRQTFFQDLLSVYAYISAGPHFVSGVPDRQSEGFIFSDNFMAGVNVRLHDNLYLDLRPGFRHISNAGLKPRNGGVNNNVLSGGVLINLK